MSAEKPEKLNARQVLEKAARGEAVAQEDLIEAHLRVTISGALNRMQQNHMGLVRIGIVCKEVVQLLEGQGHRLEIQ